MKFDFVKDPVDPSQAHPSKKWYPRPVIPIKLIGPSDGITVLALIDSGADWCVFQGKYGELIGIDVTSGKKQSMKGIGSGEMIAYFHNIEVNVGDGTYSCLVGFSHQLDYIPYALLGQDGFFDHFSVQLDQKKGRIELRRHKS